MPIFQRITIDGKRIEVSTGKYIEEAKWNASTSKVRGTNDDARIINEHLDTMRSNIFNAEKSLIKKDIPVSVDSLKEIISGAKPRARMLVPIFQDHNNRIKELIGREYAAGTLKRSFLRFSVLILSFATSIPSL